MYIHHRENEGVVKALPDLLWRLPYLVASGVSEELIAFQVQVQPLEQVREIEQPITAPLQDPDLVVVALDKSECEAKGVRARASPPQSPSSINTGWAEPVAHTRSASPASPW